MEISKEVESALEEEGYVKIDSTSPSTMPTATITSPVSLTDNTSSLSAGSSVNSQPVSRVTSPVQQQIRADLPLSNAPKNTAVKSPYETNLGSSSSLSTWQRQNSGQTSEDDQVGSMWSWMSSAVSAGLQTTQNLGRNIVEKTKVNLFKIFLNKFRLLNQNTVYFDIKVYLSL